MIRMQQRFRKLALFVGATTLAAGGLFMLACGTDNGTAVATPPLPEAGPKGDGGGGGSETGTGSETGPTPDGGGADADCSKNPILRDFTNGFRCPFIAPNGDAGSNCNNNQTCCETSDKLSDGGFAPSYCAAGTKGDGNATCTAAAGANSSTFVKGDAWECADKNGCAAGEVCCMIVDPGQLAMGKTLGIGNTLSTDKNHPPACGVQRAFNEGGSRCKATCAAGDKKLCSLSDMNCAAGTTCTPFVDFQQTHRGTCL
ncbi:MAG: hypothetical protein JWO86_2987 [Myxococcaceae bacterium]|nr:hypothetical protein [Myxococcaceae bacterium]